MESISQGNAMLYENVAGNIESFAIFGTKLQTKLHSIDTK